MISSQTFLNFCCNLTSLNSTPILVTPFVRGIARKHEINLSEIKGTGKHFGNITEQDIDNFLKLKQDSSSQIIEKVEKTTTTTTTNETGGQLYGYKLPPLELMPDDRVEKVRGLKRGMIKSMQLATLVPHTGCFDEYEVDNFIQLRQTLKPLAIDKGVKLSFTALFIKAASLALNKHPLINSSLSPDHSEIIFHKAHNVSIAMDTPQGLIVPNIKHCEEKSIFQIAKDLSDLVDRAKIGKLGTEDLKNGTFTLSNVGPITGGTYFRPILMPHETCIVALSDFKKVPKVNEKDQIVIKTIGHASFSCDHRVVEGAELLRFSNSFKDYVQNPHKMIAELK